MPMLMCLFVMLQFVTVCLHCIQNSNKYETFVYIYLFDLSSVVHGNTNEFQPYSINYFYTETNHYE